MATRSDYFALCRARVSRYSLRAESHVGRRCVWTFSACCAVPCLPFFPCANPAHATCNSCDETVLDIVRGVGLEQTYSHFATFKMQNKSESRFSLNAYWTLSGNVNYCCLVSVQPGMIRTSKSYVGVVCLTCRRSGSLHACGAQPSSCRRHNGPKAQSWASCAHSGMSIVSSATPAERPASGAAQSGGHYTCRNTTPLSPPPCGVPCKQIVRATLHGNIRTNPSPAYEAQGSTKGRVSAILFVSTYSLFARNNPIRSFHFQPNNIYRLAFQFFPCCQKTPL